MLKVYICPICGSYRFVTSYNYTLLQMRLPICRSADIEYKNYIELSSDERQAITKKYAGEHYE